ncbi:MAG: hypothetical protein ACI86H_002634 [bacterium]|jgi:hypothetical protein
MSEFVLDFSNTQQIDSTVLGFISWLIKFDVQIKLVCSPDSFVYQLFQNYTLFSALSTSPSLYDALVE